MYDANFAGDRVKNYKQLVKLCRLIGNVKKAFPPTPDDGDSYFEQCLSTFDQNMLKTFAQKLHSSKARELVKKAKTFQRDTVKTWNPSVGQVSQIVHIGLVGLDEGASMPCGAITLDLLLRAGVLVTQKNGHWELASD